ncbi:MAG: 23S rRNA (pseudouridine(1915)-N(3))-methyltransferase RlmH [Candidatus Zixiibacteriota bacterium]|nr:MAG: 23S rRNA (pseudouridine(1915)-N(3))-methyltransferase RlmH [candidate division Zixibacteria bacterium]
MFKIHLIAVGKNKERWVREGVAHYAKLLGKFTDLSIICIPEIRKTKNISETEVIRREIPLIEKRLSLPYRIALAQTGKAYDSHRLARQLSKILTGHGGGCDVIIGGAYGLHRNIIEDCHEVLSLSPMTMSHQLIRVVFLEQLYRAFSILAGGKYHK